MSSDLIKALQISALGVGLVFLGILFLWGMMELTVWLTALKKPRGESQPPIHKPVDNFQDLRKAVAAAAAAAIALQDTPNTAQIPQTREQISPWQTAHRSHQMRHGLAASTRRKRGWTR